MHAYNDICFNPIPLTHCDGIRLLQNYQGTAKFASDVLDQQGAIIPPPDPQLLAFHLAFCRVFHASGMATIQDDIERDAEDIICCAEDGFTAIHELVRSRLLVQDWRQGLS